VADREQAEALTAATIQRLAQETAEAEAAHDARLQTFAQEHASCSKRFAPSRSNATPRGAPMRTPSGAGRTRPRRIRGESTPCETRKHRPASA
jgi:hypothetical protein